jgi:hypothetical protein
MNILDNILNTRKIKGLDIGIKGVPVLYYWFSISKL